MAPPQRLVDAAKHLKHNRKTVCIHLGPYSRIQREAVWQHGDQACINHLGREIIDRSIESVRRS